MASLLWNRTNIADHQCMSGVLTGIDGFWTWRMSAYWRIASLLSLWAVFMLMGPLGWLFAPIAGVRSLLSMVQTGLNIRLGRMAPLEKQTRFDWALVGAVFAGAYFAAGVAQFGGTGLTPAVVVPMLLPFSLLQIRMAGRSLEAAVVAEMRPAAITRLEEYRRTERGELKAA